MKNHLIAYLIITFVFANKMLAQTAPTAVNELIQRGQYVQAIAALEKMPISDSTQIDILQKQALCNLKLGRISQARKLYQTLLLRNPDSVENLLQLAVVSEKEYNLLEAFRSYQKLNSLDTLNTFYWKELARMSVRMEHPKDAVLYFKKAILIDNKDIESLASLASLYLNKGDSDLAEPLVKTAFLLDSTSIRIRHLRSRIAYTSSDFKAVMKDILFTMSLGDTTSYYQRFLGTSYYYLDSLPQSISTFKRLIKLNEKTENVYAGLAFAQLKMAKGRHDSKIFEAYTNFHEAIDLGTSVHLSDYEMGLADLEDKLGNVLSAIGKFDKLKGNRPKAIFRLGEIYEQKKNDKEMALIYYQEYIDACGKLQKPTSDCNFIAQAKSRINALNSNLKIELPQTATAKDTSGMLVDTARHHDK
jgi:tetratricopeptide (TPR) repeat protein